ncbi:hypothetical protein [Anaerocolumna xylanovorans]|uniref:Uncharacterized protein n=1 Tax=Anaerocolumna xylanovorans DSM 12503 TaxID=1121345 RepID=A0A1M7YCC0_9FIRM|nr:hypothetical protein [Anaerocolumna xylanovorans]SHO50158.1 hypothetical protein SAMN02745217_02609 [Anaerocolumna xylanovorans DSM 12503]
MADKERSNKEKAENLKAILSGFGIHTNSELDSALSDALEAMTIGIMTEKPMKVRNTA